MDTMPQTRRHAVDDVRRQLLRRGWPRLEMLLLVMLTGGAGFVASFLLLRGGFDDMWMRYPLAMAVAYAVFLGLLWLWLHTRSSDWADALADAATDIDMRGGGWGGDGGRSGGGGASASYDSPSLEDGVLDAVADPVGTAIGSVAEADEAAIPLAAVLLVAALAAVLLLSSLFVVWSAPVLFAELLVDSLLAAGLYRRLRRVQPRYWLETAVRRTWLPFLLTLALVTAAGWGMAKYAPEAHSLGEVVAHGRT
ncbi:hypothetical protein ACFPOA_12925 [Lysobacter niabensis]|uniref:hypothetical protein n=1 Tax=Agrilutibacter niabensis TaxID=380628 RepID=UPI00361121AA